MHPVPEEGYKLGADFILLQGRERCYVQWRDPSFRGTRYDVLSVSQEPVWILGQVRQFFALDVIEGAGDISSFCPIPASHTGFGVQSSVIAEANSPSRPSDRNGPVMISHPLPEWAPEYRRIRGVLCAAYDSIR